jgi:Ca-activated chloride channel family protein
MSFNTVMNHGNDSKRRLSDLLHKMIFLNGYFLVLLLIIPPLWRRSRRGVRSRSIESIELGRSGTPSNDGRIAWIAAIALSAFAAAGPMWGSASPRSRSVGQDLAIVIDVSRSMGVEDAAPNRLAVAIRSARSLIGAIAESRGSRVGLIAFAGRGVVRSPLTESFAGVDDALGALKPGGVKPGGSDLGAAIRAARDLFDDQPHPEGRTIVVLSDGEDHEGSWRDELVELRNAHIIVHTIAIGDAEKGGPVPIYEEESERVLTYQGRPVTSRRDDRALEAIARETGGVFLPIGTTSADLGSLYRKTIAPAAKRVRERLEPPERAHRYAPFVSAALAIGVIGSWPGFGRKRRSKVRKPLHVGFGAMKHVPKRDLDRNAASVNAPSLIILLLFMIFMISGANSEPSARDWASSGASAFQKRDYTAALEAFERCVRLDPRSPIARYNAAEALYQLGRDAEAIVRYREARARTKNNNIMILKIDYGLANALLGSGDLRGSISAYDRCSANKAKGLIADRVRRDAAVNRAFAVGLLNPPKSSSRPPNDAESDGAPKPNPRRPRSTVGESSGGDSPPPANSTRRTGGAGGGSSSPPGREVDPAATLENAIQRIKDSKNRRPFHEIDAPDPERKDW